MVYHIRSSEISGGTISRRTFVESEASVFTLRMAGCLSEVGGDASGGLTIGFYGSMTDPADNNGEY